MIASVRGEVLVRRPDHVVVEASGVGYRLSVSSETLRAVPALGKQATLHTHLILRDDAISLYGFASEDERDLFLSLISVSGVGPKVALAALSDGSVRELIKAIAASDAKRFQAVPGIGKRTAERIIVELRERVVEAAVDGVPDAEGEQPEGEEGGPRAEARDGLLGLGYTPAEADKLLEKASGASAEEILKAALKASADRSAA